MVKSVPVHFYFVLIPSLFKEFQVKKQTYKSSKAKRRPGLCCNVQPVTARHHLNFDMHTQPTWSADTCDVGIKGHGLARSSQRPR